MAATELYVTTAEQEAYDLVGQLALPPAQVRARVEAGTTKHGRLYYVVLVEASELDRARAVRRRLFGS